MEKSQDVRKDYGKIFQDAFLRMIHFDCFCNCISPVKGQVLGSKAKKKQNKTPPHFLQNAETRWICPFKIWQMDAFSSSFICLILSQQPALLVSHCRLSSYLTPTINFASSIEKILNFLLSILTLLPWYPKLDQCIIYRFSGTETFCSSPRSPSDQGFDYYY